LYDFELESTFEYTTLVDVPPALVLEVLFEVELTTELLLLNEFTFELDVLLDTDLTIESLVAREVELLVEFDTDITRD